MIILRKLHDQEWEMLSHESGLSKRLPKQYKVLWLPLVARHMWKVSSYYERHQGIQNQDSEDPGLELWNMSSEKTSCHVNRKHCASFQRKGQPTILPIYDAHEPQMTSMAW